LVRLIPHLDDPFDRACWSRAIDKVERANVSPTSEAQLFFAQARKIRTNEEDEAALAGNVQEADDLEGSVSHSARRATSALPPVEEEAESDEEPVRRRKEGGRKKR